MWCTYIWVIYIKNTLHIDVQTATESNLFGLKDTLSWFCREYKMHVKGFPGILMSHAYNPKQIATKSIDLLKNLPNTFFNNMHPSLPVQIFRMHTNIYIMFYMTIYMWLICDAFSNCQAFHALQTILFHLMQWARCVRIVLLYLKLKHQLSP